MPSLKSKKVIHFNLILIVHGTGVLNGELRLQKVPFWQELGDSILWLRTWGMKSYRPKSSCGLTPHQLYDLRQVSSS